MYLDKEIDRLITRLRASEKLTGVGIIKAYPYAPKPTCLNKCVIVLSPGSMNIKNEAIGDNVFFGKYSIDAVMFAPQDMGSPVALTLASDFLAAAVDNDVSSIYISDTEKDDTVRCYSRKCTLTFYSDFVFGDDDDGTV